MSDLRKAIDGELASLQSLLWLTPYLGELQAKLFDLKEFLDQPRYPQEEQTEVASPHHWLL